jgi:hypothetical protein
MYTAAVFPAIPEIWKLVYQQLIDLPGLTYLWFESMFSDVKACGGSKAVQSGQATGRGRTG